MIRPASIKDLDAICALNEQSWDAHKKKDYSYTVDDFSWYLKHDKPAIILVTENVEGFIFGYDLELWGYIEHIVVDEKYRWKGHARELVEAFMKCNARWSIVESCYYSEVPDMGIVFQSLGFVDNAFQTNWVYKNK